MDGIPTLPGGCKSLSDTVRVIAQDGQLLPLMTLAQAQTLAREQHADLIHLVNRSEPVFRLVDEKLWSTIRGGQG